MTWQRITNVHDGALSIFLGASSLPIVALYPFMKRYTYWPQSVLGMLEPNSSEYLRLPNL